MLKSAYRHTKAAFSATGDAAKKMAEVFGASSTDVIEDVEDTKKYAKRAMSKYKSEIEWKKALAEFKLQLMVNTTDFSRQLEQIFGDPKVNALITSIAEKQLLKDGLVDAEGRVDPNVLMSEVEKIKGHLGNYYKNGILDYITYSAKLARDQRRDAQMMHWMHQFMGLGIDPKRIAQLARAQGYTAKEAAAMKNYFIKMDKGRSEFRVGISDPFLALHGISKSFLNKEKGEADEALRKMRDIFDGNDDDFRNFIAVTAPAVTEFIGRMGTDREMRETMKAHFSKITGVYVGKMSEAADKANINTHDNSAEGIEKRFQVHEETLRQFGEMMAVLSEKIELLNKLCQDIVKQNGVMKEEKTEESATKEKKREDDMTKEGNLEDLHNNNDDNIVSACNL